MATRPAGRGDEGWARAGVTVCLVRHGRTALIRAGVLRGRLDLGSGNGARHRHRCVPEEGHQT
jgi:hypothetical protein